MNDVLYYCTECDRQTGDRILGQHMEGCNQPWKILNIQPSVDIINHPPHYNSSGSRCECGKQIECIDITRELDFNIGNAIKYLWRYKHKNGIEDLKKAVWYINDKINNLSPKPVDNSVSK